MNPDEGRTYLLPQDEQIAPSLEAISARASWRVRESLNGAIGTSWLTPVWTRVTRGALEGKPNPVRISPPVSHPGVSPQRLAELAAKFGHGGDNASDWGG